MGLGVVKFNGSAEVLGRVTTKVSLLATLKQMVDTEQLVHVQVC